MIKPIKITFLVTNHPHCITTQYIINYFNQNKRPVETSYIIQDQYINTNCRQFCDKFGYLYHELPRIDGTKHSLWNTPNCIVKNIQTVRCFYRKYLSEFKPDIVIIVPYENGPFEVELIIACKRFGIKTLILQEGLIITDDNKDPGLMHADDNYFLLNPENEPFKYSRIKSCVAFIRKLKNLNQPKTLISKVFEKVFLAKIPPCRPFGLNGADYVGTLSPFYSSKLIYRGLSPKQLRPVGLARFDEIEKYRNNEILSTSARKKDSLKLTVLFPQTWGFGFGKPPDQIYSIETECKTLKIISEVFPKEIFVKYRIRATENIDHYNIFLKETKGSIVIEEASKISAYESIIKSDVIITTGSTMLLEALALGKIGILFNPYREDYYGYVREGGCLMAYDHDSLISAINKILQFPDLRVEMIKKAKKYVIDRAMIDGHASERTSKFIEDIISWL